MSRLSPRTAVFAFAAVLAAFFFNTILSRRFQNPFPPLTQTLSSPLNRLEDFVGVSLGTRRLMADLAWIETLEYYGTHEEDQSDYQEDNGAGHYPLFLSYCQRVGRIDPYFTYVYYYGAGALGWNLGRINEAETLLQEGIKANPTEWRLQQYLAGLSYEKDHNPLQMISFLNSYLEDPDCPNLLRNILAHLYEKQHLYVDALRVLLVMKATNDPVYTPTADREIQVVLPHLREKTGS